LSESVIGALLIGKSVERSGRGIIEVTIPALAGGTEENHGKP
jgi:hypothetical protein